MAAPMDEAQVASIRIYGFMSALRDIAPLIFVDLFCYQWQQ